MMINIRTLISAITGNPEQARNATPHDGEIAEARGKIGGGLSVRRPGKRYSKMIAVTGQLSAACWQSQVPQPFGSVTHAFSSRSSKTLGHSSEQRPQPMQSSMSTDGVAMMLYPFSCASVHVGGSSRNAGTCGMQAILHISALFCKRICAPPPHGDARSARAKNIFTKTGLLHIICRK